MRLVKNREYAQSSRIKKKQHVEELEDENQALRDKVQRLEEENRKLKMMMDPAYSKFDSNMDMQISHQQAPSFPCPEFPVPSYCFDSGDMGQLLSQNCDISDIPFEPPEFKNPLSFSGSFSSTFCFFMVVLSFGIFISSFQGLDIRMGLNQQAILSQSGATQFYPSGRVLLSHQQNSDPIIQANPPSAPEVKQTYVRKDISYYEVLLDEMNHTTHVKN